MEDEKKEIQEENAVVKAEKIAERMELANKKAEELLKKNEDVLSRLVLGGRSAVQPPVEKKEESPKEYANRMLHGGK